MKIYTKTGDSGTTALFTGGRVDKDHARVQAYGTLDEANSALGLAISHLQGSTDQRFKEALTNIQNQIFVVGSELATPDVEKLKMPLIDESAVEQLERQIDQWNEQLPALKNFILPGGHLSASAIHMARTIIRRGERQVVQLSKSENIRPIVVKYLNRLSDTLFVAARFSNLIFKNEEVTWKS